MRLAALTAWALLGAGAAGAQTMDRDNPTCPSRPNWSDTSEMRFTVQQRPGQSPVLLAEGAIDENLVPRLHEALERFDGDEVWLRSIGGDARAGNEAGRIIRERGLLTRIPADWACRGACNFMFMGGIGRYIDNGGLFIVQMFTLDGPAGDPVERARVAAVVATEDHEFLRRMGVSPRLLSDVMYRQSARGTRNDPSTYRCLSQAEIMEYRVVNTLASR
jgi:hypothetical protein